jgi:uracil-DNA glycosylase family 4
MPLSRSSSRVRRARRESHGRIFTGDPSGDLLYAALHAVGVASQPTSTHRGDGLKLDGVRITVPVHCAPPNNQPTTVERDTCRPWLARELQLLMPTLSVIVVLGGFAWQALLPVLPLDSQPPHPDNQHNRQPTPGTASGRPEHR